MNRSADPRDTAHASVRLAAAAEPLKITVRPLHGSLPSETGTNADRIAALEQYCGSGDERLAAACSRLLGADFFNKQQE